MWLAARDAERNNIEELQYSASTSTRDSGLCKSRKDNSISFRDYHETIAKYIQEVPIRMQKKKKEIKHSWIEFN